MWYRWVVIVIAFGLSMLVGVFAAQAQQLAKVPRIGFLFTGTPRTSCTAPPFLRALHTLGYVEGETILIEWRCPEGSTDRANEFARELVQLKVDAIMASGRTAILAAKHATSTIPILCAPCGGDPVPELVPSLAQPGGNLTGVTNIAGYEFFAKHLELLLDAVPGLTRVALLLAAGDPFKANKLPPVERAARPLGVEVYPVEAEVPQGLEAAFATMRSQGVGALLVAFTAIFSPYRAEIAELAITHRLPAINDERGFAVRGGLMAYGWDSAEGLQVVASYLDRILKGAKPGDLPIQLPTTYKLVINLKTAQALGLTISPTLLFRADEVIR